MSGNAEGLESYLGSVTDSGRWWVEANRLCHKWSTWFGGEVQCLRLRKDGSRIYWQNQSGMSGTAVIVSVPDKAAAPVLAEAPPGRMKLSGPAVTSSPLVARDSRSAGTSRASPEPVATHRVANVRADDVLNVREGPSADDPVVGTLAPETRGIAITGACRLRWCPVTGRNVSGWVNSAFLSPEAGSSGGSPAPAGAEIRDRDSASAPRTCLTEPARALLDEIETRFGRMRLISTCRPGATIAGTGRPSRHASGNAIDFDAGRRKAEVVDWLVANHQAGGTMTYADMDHIHVDIGRHFVSLAGGRPHTTGGAEPPEWSGSRMGLTGTRWR